MGQEHSLYSLQRLLPLRRGIEMQCPDCHTQSQVTTTLRYDRQGHGHQNHLHRRIQPRYHKLMKQNITPQVRGQINTIVQMMDKLTDRIAKNNADNLKTLCEIAVLLQNIEEDHLKTNQILLKGK